MLESIMKYKQIQIIVKILQSENERRSAYYENRKEQKYKITVIKWIIS